LGLEQVRACLTEEHEPCCWLRKKGKVTGKEDVGADTAATDRRGCEYHNPSEVQTLRARCELTNPAPR